MTYNPSFSRNIKGKFNPELGFVSIKSGTDAYLIEDDLNEMQWIQNETRAALIRRLSNSGCSQKNPFSINNTRGGLKELFSNQLNGFLLCEFDAILNGYLATINSSSLNGNIITLPTPPSSGTRYDFVFLEFWFKELKNYEPIKQFGGINNDNIPYEMIDSRMGVETSHRVQLQWNIRAVENIDYSTYAEGFVNALEISNTNLHPKCGNDNEFTSFVFKRHELDTNLFISKCIVDWDTTELGTADGYVYAIPLFFVKRLNNGGYHEIDNPNGAINWVDINSESGRPDAKFANWIYQDQVIDVRHLAILAKDQLEPIFTLKSDFEVYKTFIENNTTNIMNDITNITNNIINGPTGLQSQIDVIKDNQVDIILPHITESDQKIANLQIGFANMNSNVNTILTVVSNLDVRLTLVENELKQLGIDLIFSGLVYFGTDLSFGDVSSSQGELLPPDNKINCAGAFIASPFTEITHEDYSVLYTVESSPSGKLGDVWIEKADTNALFKNSGNMGIKVNYTVIKKSPVVTIESATFNSMTGIHIDRPLKTGNKQIETATVSVTTVTAGTIDVIVTAFGMSGTPKTVPVSLVGGETADQVAEKIRTALGNDLDVSAFFNVSGSGTSVVITTETIADFDNTMNINIVGGNGVDAASTSVSTTGITEITDFLFITPTSNTYGTIGEIYYTTDATGFTVYNTGHDGTTFDYIIIDTTKLRNCTFTTVDYTGHISTYPEGGIIPEGAEGYTGEGYTITGEFGTNFKAFIGPSNIPTEDGSIGDVSIERLENMLTINNTGSSIDGTTTAQVLIFTDMTLLEANGT